MPILQGAIETNAPPSPQHSTNNVISNRKPIVTMSQIGRTFYFWTGPLHCICKLSQGIFMGRKPIFIRGGCTRLTTHPTHVGNFEMFFPPLSVSAIFRWHTCVPSDRWIPEEKTGLINFNIAINQLLQHSFYVGDVAGIELTHRHILIGLRESHVAREDNSSLVTGHAMKDQ